MLMKDKDAAAVARGERMINEDLLQKQKKKRLTAHEVCDIQARVVPLHDGEASWTRHFSQADIVIEAVFEEIGVKHAVLKAIEDVIPTHCVFASNTSAIPIGQIAAGSKRPERVIGMHYFSPVPAMPLLEIILHSGTAPEVAAVAMEVGSRQGKTPIFVKDVAGFYVNRCLGPFMSEVTALVEEGVDLLLIDKAMKDFGFPVGPITLTDQVGLDISAHVGSFMAKSDLGVRMTGGNNEVIPMMVKKGWLGKKAGKGFFLYEDDKKGKKGGGGGKARPLNPEVLAFLKPFQKVTEESRKITAEDIQSRIISR